MNPQEGSRKRGRKKNSGQRSREGQLSLVYSTEDSTLPEERKGEDMSRP